MQLNVFISFSRTFESTLQMVGPGPLTKEFVPTSWESTVKAQGVSKICFLFNQLATIPIKLHDFGAALQIKTCFILLLYDYVGLGLWVTINVKLDIFNTLPLSK